MSAEQIVVRLDEIDMSPRTWRPCNYRNQTGWAEFLSGIEQHGLRVRPELRKAMAGPYAYEPVTSLRAILGAAEAGLHAVECIVLQDCDDFDASLLAFQRALTDGDPPGIVLERGWAMLHLQSELQKRGLPASGVALAKATGLSQSYVSDCRTIASELPRETLLRLAVEEAVPDYLAVSLPRDCLKALRRIEPARRVEVLRTAIRATREPGRGRATAIVKAAATNPSATGDPAAKASAANNPAGAGEPVVRLEANQAGLIAVKVGTSTLELTRRQAADLFAALKPVIAARSRWPGLVRRIWEWVRLRLPRSSGSGIR